MGTAAANGSEGLVDEPLELSSADLDDPPGRTQRVAALCCAGDRRRELGEVADIPGETPGGRTRSATLPGPGGSSRRSGVRSVTWPIRIEVRSEPSSRHHQQRTHRLLSREAGLGPADGDRSRTRAE